MTRKRKSVLTSVLISAALTGTGALVWTGTKDLPACYGPTMPASKASSTDKRLSPGMQTAPPPSPLP